MKCANRCETVAGEPDWGRIANHLARKALDNHTPLPRGEIYSLAGLAVAMIRADYDPKKGGRGIGPWTCRYGWLQLVTLMRNAIGDRARGAREVSFTDLAGRRAGPERIGRAEYALQSALARPPAPRTGPEWLDRLTPTERRIVWMRVGGWTLNEIALFHGRSRCWVGRRLRRLRRRLADLKPWCMARRGSRLRRAKTVGTRPLADHRPREAINPQTPDYRGRGNEEPSLP